MISCLFLISLVSSSLSPECQIGWDGMMSDPNFQYVNSSMVNACYFKYQNDMALDPSAIVSCDWWEYAEFCTIQIRGTSCILQTGFVNIPLCIPSLCTAEDLPFIVNEYFNGTAGHSIDCTQSSNVSPLLPAVISTVSVIAVTALLVFLLRPPRSVREAAKLSRAQKRMMHQAPTNDGQKSSTSLSSTS
jgi:hypothetical protein